MINKKKLFLEKISINLLSINNIIYIMIII